MFAVGWRYNVGFLPPKSAGAEVNNFDGRISLSKTRVFEREAGRSTALLSVRVGRAALCDFDSNALPLPLGTQVIITT
jgi:hypothetical protein